MIKISDFYVIIPATDVPKPSHHIYCFTGPYLMLPGPALGVRAGPHPWANHLFELLGAQQQSAPPTEPGEPRNRVRFNTIPPDREEETNRVYNVGKKMKWG